MNSGIDISEQSELENCLKNKEVNNRLCKFFEVLIKINSREKLVKGINEDNKTNINNSSIRQKELSNNIQ